MGSARLKLVIEEHGDENELIRFKVWPYASRVAIILVAALMVLVLAAEHDRATSAAAALLPLAVLLGGRLLWECTSSLATIVSLFQDGGVELESPFSYSTSTAPENAHFAPATIPFESLTAPVQMSQHGAPE